MRFFIAAFALAGLAQGIRLELKEDQFTRARSIYRNFGFLTGGSIDVEIVTEKEGDSKLIALAALDALPSQRSLDELCKTNFSDIRHIRCTPKCTGRIDIDETATLSVFLLNCGKTVFTSKGFVHIMNPNTELPLGMIPIPIAHGLMVPLALAVAAIWTGYLMFSRQAWSYFHYLLLVAPLLKALHSLVSIASYMTANSKGVSSPSAVSVTEIIAGVTYTIGQYGLLLCIANGAGVSKLGQNPIRLTSVGILAVLCILLVIDSAITAFFGDVFILFQIILVASWKVILVTFALFSLLNIQQLLEERLSNPLPQTHQEAEASRLRHVNACAASMLVWLITTLILALARYVFDVEWRWLLISVQEASDFFFIVTVLISYALPSRTWERITRRPTEDGFGNSSSNIGSLRNPAVRERALQMLQRRQLLQSEVRE